MIQKTLFHFHLVLCLVSFFVNVASSKSASDYYHSGAAMYVEGRNQQAKIELEEGLRKYPQDEKLTNLVNHLKEMEKQQQDQNKQNQGQG